jgi:hypothetical protein
MLDDKMELELRIENDENGRKIKLPDQGDTINYSAHAFVEEILTLTAVVDGKRMYSHYQKDNNTWNKVGATHFGILVLGEESYSLETPEYQAFELLNK